MLELFSNEQIKIVNALVALYRGDLESFDANDTSFVEEIDIHETWILDSLHFVDYQFENLFTIFDGEVIAIADIRNPKIRDFVEENKATFADKDDAIEFLEFLEALEMFGDFI